MIKTKTFPRLFSLQIHNECNVEGFQHTVNEQEGYKCSHLYHDLIEIMGHFLFIRLKQCLAYSRPLINISVK